MAHMLVSRPREESMRERLLSLALAANLVFPAGNTREAVRMIERALGDGRLLRDVGPELPLLWGCVYLLAVAGELDVAERHALEGLAEADARESIDGLTLANHQLADIEWRRGRLHRAEVRLGGSGAVARRASHYVRAADLHVRLEVLIERGCLDHADREARRMPVSWSPKTPLVELFALCSRGRLRLAQGLPEHALEDLLRIPQLTRVDNPAVLPWRSHAGLALVALGRRDEARGLIDKELALARGFGAARPIGKALRAAGVLEGRDGGAELLRESVAVLEAGPSRLEHAHSLAELGSALRRGAHRNDAVAPLRAALHIAIDCGARPLAERARRELLDARSRPRRQSHDGRDTLTASELRVARMAADGTSNKQIARALFVSLRTVETHLTHVYSKLEIAGRAGLSAALAAMAP